MARPAKPNPLAVAFGAALRLARQRIPTRSIAATIGVEDSSYRLIESGRNHPSIGKVPAIHRAFASSHGKVRPQPLSFDALVALVTAIGSSEEGPGDNPNRKRGIRLHRNVQALLESLPDRHCLRPLLQKFLEPLSRLTRADLRGQEGLSVLQAIDSSGLDPRELVAAAHLDVETHRSLIEERPPSAPALTADGYYSGFFRNIPSLYEPLFESLRREVMRLPRTVSASTSWEWEGLNCERFSQLAVICSSRHLLPLENLRAYSYDYLWNHDFAKITFVLYDDSHSPADAAAVFHDNLRAALEHKNTEKDRARLATLEETLAKKTVFLTCSKVPRQDVEALMSVDTESPNADALMLFQTHSGALIGATARFSSETVIARSISFLTFDQCIEAARRWRVAFGIF